MTSKTHKQSAAGIIPDAAPTTFAEVLAKINASDAWQEANAHRIQAVDEMLAVAAKPVNLE